VVFSVSAVLYSDAGKKRVEVESGFTGSCTGVRADCRSVVPERRQCWRRVLSRVQRRLQVMQLAGEWIELEPPSVRVDSELRAMVDGTRGVSLADASSTTESSWPRRRVSTTRLISKLLYDGVPLDLGGGGCSRLQRWTEVEFADEIDMHGG
jgi:hypothetical protein